MEIHKLIQEEVAKARFLFTGARKIHQDLNRVNIALTPAEENLMKLVYKHETALKQAEDIGLSALTGVLPTGEKVGAARQPAGNWKESVDQAARYFKAVDTVENITKQTRTLEERIYAFESRRDLLLETEDVFSDLTVSTLTNISQSARNFRRIAEIENAKDSLNRELRLLKWEESRQKRIVKFIKSIHSGTNKQNERMAIAAAESEARVVKAYQV